MRGVIKSILITVMLGFFTVASAQLPLEIRADAYLLQAEQAIRNGNHNRAQAAIQNILRLQKEHELDLSDEFHFRYAKVADAVDLPDQALESVLKYLVASGREGQHYVEALALMNKVQDRSLGDVVASQLSPNIITDAYLLQAEQSIRDGDHNQARDAVQNIRNLQEQHELDLPNEFHFRYAKAADVLDLPDQALESVVKYLAVSGREEQHYLEALTLMNKVQTAVSCKGWDTEEYFNTATLEQVTACLDTEVDLEARNYSGITPLHRAVKNTENLDVIKALLNAGADKEARDHNKMTPLHWATAYNNPVAIKALIKAGADLDVQDKDKQTPLHHTVKNTENLDVVKALIEAGADLDLRDKYEQTPLGDAVSFGHSAAIRILIEAGADRELANAKWTPLNWAVAYNENPVTIKALLNAGANPKARDGYRNTPLHIAAKFNKNPDILKVLIDAGAAPMARDNDGNTPLHGAAWYNENPDVVKVLLDAGAAPMARNEYGYTPLHAAAGHNENPDVVKVLLDAGADPMARNKYGYTPLHAAAGHNENSDVVKVLLDAGAAPMARNNDGYTPLHRAARDNENSDVVKVLLDAGAAPMARAGGFYTPLRYAARYNENPDVVKVLLDAGAEVKSSYLFRAARYNENPGVVKVLLDAGVDPNARTAGDRTPLHLAAEYNENPDVVKVLLDAGAAPMARNNDGYTPLHRAARDNENSDVVKALLSAGADPNARTTGSNWRTPLHLAATYNENPDVVKVLLDAGAAPMARDNDGYTPLHAAAGHNENSDVIKVLLNAGTDPNARAKNGYTPLDIATINENSDAAGVLRAAGATTRVKIAKESKKESGLDLGKTAIALIGGAAITYAGKDSGDPEAVAEAARQFMAGVLNEQPVGSGDINSATTPSQSQGGQVQDPMQQALQNLENVCGEKYQSDIADYDHARFYCLAAFNDYCALKRAQSSDAISKLRASLQQNCAVLKKDGLDSKCSYCK